jgi:anti-anti-sigma factor
MTAQVDIDVVDGTRVVSIEGEVDMANAQLVREALAAGAPAPLVVDLTRCAFMDSTGMRTLFQGAQDAGGTPVVVCSPGNPIRELLNITSVDAVYRIVPTLDEGLAAAAEPD